MKIIVPFSSQLLFDGKILNISRSALPTYTGDPMTIIPECRGVKLPKINLYPNGMGDDVYLVDETYINCLKYCIDTYPELFKDILGKYDFTIDKQYAYCFEEIIRETLVGYTTIQK